MSNPIFQALGGQGQNPMLQNFQRFMQQMQGKDPNQIIQQMGSRGRMSRARVGQAQGQGRQRESLVEPMRGMFGKGSQEHKK